MTSDGASLYTSNASFLSEIESFPLKVHEDDDSWDKAKEALSEYVIFTKYAKYLPEENRRETWNDIIDRNKAMHLSRFPKLKDEIEDSYALVYQKKILPSMRSLQFAGKPTDLNESRIFNCSFLPIDDITAFSEVMFLLLSGVGVGYSVQRHHINKLPPITKPIKTRRFLVGDSIEGWADSIKILMKAYFLGKPLPNFDFNDIRPKGAQLITSGGKAPGPEPLKACLQNISRILDRKETGDSLTTLEAHDICCFIADAVLAGGIRRSACISLFNLDDEDMLTCKFGDWWEANPQRGRSNNSAVIMRHTIKKPVFIDLWKKIQMSGTGEPGFFFSNDKDMGINPCAEISLKPFQMCNLVTINSSTVTSQQDFNNRAKKAAFIATLQASFTNFHYLRDIWKTTTEKEALIGVSMTGIASGKVLKLDMVEASNAVVAENKRVANLIGINPSARCTAIKPEGTASCVLGTSSGIHAWNSDFYIRRIRVGKNEAIYSYLNENHPEMIEDEYFKPTQQAVISFPQKAPKGAITRQESALNMLERVKRVYSDWIVPGHVKGANKNNVSATVTIKPHEWEEVGEWMWENRTDYTALSVLPYSDHTYIQAPFEDCDKETYERMLKSLSKFHLEYVIENEDYTSQRDQAACAAGMCEVI